MTPAAIEAAARALHRFNAPRVANDVEPWESVPPNTQARWRKQAELALLAANEADPPPGAWDLTDADKERIAREYEAASRDPFARLSRPNIETDEPPEAA